MSHQTPENRELCHFCAKMRKTVVKFNMPSVVKLPSGRTKIHLCTHCIANLDEIATDSLKHPSQKP